MIIYNEVIVNSSINIIINIINSSSSSSLRIIFVLLLFPSCTRFVLLKTNRLNFARK